MAKKKPAAKKVRMSLADQVKSEVERQIPKVETGIVVAIPSTVEEKMSAICDLSVAIRDLAKAINSTNVNVRVEGCSFQNHETGLKIQ